MFMLKSPLGHGRYNRIEYNNGYECTCIYVADSSMPIAYMLYSKVSSLNSCILQGNVKNKGNHDYSLLKRLVTHSNESLLWGLLNICHFS